MPPDKSHKLIDAALEELQKTYGTSLELERSDKVLLMDGWNKILGWETMWKEAFWFRWRILCARQEIASQHSENGIAKSPEKCAAMARKVVEQNTDPIGRAFGLRRRDGKNLLLALADNQIRSLCPHDQVVQRESYRPVADDRGTSFGMTLEVTTTPQILRLFNVLGVSPNQWIKLCEAFLWALDSHNPYMGDEDVEDMELPPSQSAYAKFAADKIAKQGIQDRIAMYQKYHSPLYQEILPDFWDWVKSQSTDFGETFYTNLLTNYPELLDYFARADMDSLGKHIVLAFDLMTKFPSMVGQVDTSFRALVAHLGDIHRELGIPTDSYPKVGMNTVDSLRKYTQVYSESARSKNKNWTGTAQELEQAFGDIYANTMSFTFYPMLFQEQTILKAIEFMEQVAAELDWSPSKLSKRLLQVKLEVAKTGTYQHTAKEIEVGARLAWRNSAKCIGRISWNTLQVRDCRHVETADGIIKELQTHLEIATAGTNLQSVMTVFRPRKPDEPWGIRFWTDQLVRYACYTNQDGTTMGDTANKHITKYLIEKKLWTPPEPRTQHDVLPIVFKMPGREQPIVHTLDPKYIDEAEIFHPNYPEVAKLKHKWAAVPTINTFKMNLGGVDYGCMPFNGWFCSVEIVRDLMERYPGANENWAKAIGIDPSNHRMWKARIAHEIDVATIHSFEKAGYTIVDPDTVGEQYMTHCKREREAGRECPAQWSWIGGLVGPTNKTWHKEMRDFRMTPQYEYCCEQWAVTGQDEHFEGGSEAVLRKSSSDNSLAELDGDFEIPRVVIAYGSETGTAEAAAGRLARALRAVRPRLTSLNKISGLEIIKTRKISHLLVICSTFGKGKAPTSAATFMDTKIPFGILSQTKVSVLALGSTMYPDFCKAGKELQKMLMTGGATKLAPITLADEAIDSPGTVAQWLNLVKQLVCPTNLEEAILARSGEANEPLKYCMKWQTEKASKKVFGRVQWAESQSSLCAINDELLVDGDITKRSTRRIGFELPPGSSYVTGDHLAVHPLNSLDMVKRFAACFETELAELATDEGDKPESLVEWQLSLPFEIDCNDNGHVGPADVCFDTPATLGELLQASVSLTISQASAIDIVNAVMPCFDKESDDAVVKKFIELGSMILEGGKGEPSQDALNNFISLYPTVVNLLEVVAPIVEKSGKRIELARVLSILPRLQPRLYSISSSSTVSPDIVEVSVGVVHAVTNDGVKIAGVCSNYMARLKPRHDRAKVSIRTSSFRAPQDLVNTPMIMVGAGTGLAPMMGFLHERAHATKSGDKGVATHLFFGCRTHDERMYRGSIDKWGNDGVLDLHLALSRDTELPKAYVQDKIKEEGKLVCDLLLKNDNCHYFVCGDARMADFCYEAIIEALREHGPMSRAKATQLLTRMRVEERWQYDLWGISSYMDEGSFSDHKKKMASRKAHLALNWLARVNKTSTEDDEW